MAVDSGDNPYVATGSPTIYKYTPAGTRSVFAASDAFGLAFDSAGFLFATDARGIDSTIKKFAPDGTSTLFADTGLNGTTFIATIVPEPVAGGLIGMGTLLLTLRRKPRARAWDTR